MPILTKLQDGAALGHAFITELRRHRKNSEHCVANRQMSWLSAGLRNSAVAFNSKPNLLRANIRCAAISRSLGFLPPRRLRLSLPFFEKGNLWGGSWHNAYQ